jgi:hypothetical protein
VILFQVSENRTRVWHVRRRRYSIDEVLWLESATRFERRHMRPTTREKHGRVAARLARVGQLRHREGDAAVGRAAQINEIAGVFY